MTQPLTDEKSRALQTNYGKINQFETYFAARLRTLVEKEKLQFVLPKHDPNCKFCIIMYALEALDRYFMEKKMTLPKLGGAVWYRSRTGDYDCPAIIAATRSSLAMKNVEQGYIPNITAEENVHLVVFSAGKPGQGRTIADAEGDFLVKSPHGYSVNTSGTYQEWDIPYSPEAKPGTWRHPEE